MTDKSINLTHQLYEYLLENSLREPDALKELRVATSHRQNKHMQIAPEQGQFMRLLIEILGAKKTLDIGVFTGYSALSVALALPADGKVIACDVSTESTAIAREFWQKAGVSEKIELRIAPAENTLNELLNNGEANTFDFAFIDADKANYDLYYEKCLLLIRAGGLIAIDNVLWGGSVADPKNMDRKTVIIRELNAKILRDQRVSISMLPIGDGVTLVRKR